VLGSRPDLQAVAASGAARPQRRPDRPSGRPSPPDSGAWDSRHARPDCVDSPGRSAMQAPWGRS